MGIGFANLGASANPDINNSANAATYSGTSWTPPKDGLIVAFVVNYIAAVGNVPTMQGNNIDWVQIATVAVDPGTSHRTTLFGGIPTGSITGITGISFAAQTQLGANVSFFHVTGSVHTADGVTGSVVQTQTGNGTATSGTVTLNAAADSNNRPIACFSHQAAEVATPNPAWTEADDNNGTGPSRATETQWRADAFDTHASAAWATSAAWIGMAAEVKAQAQGAQSYDVDVSISVKGGVSDSMTNTLSQGLSFGRGEGISDAFQNAIGKQVQISMADGINNSGALGMFSVINLAEIVALLNRNNANMFTSVSVPADFGYDPSGQSLVNSDIALNKKININLLGGLNLLFSLSLSQVLALSQQAGVGIFSALNLGASIGFIPANFANIGGNINIGESLGLIDVPVLDALASLGLSERSGLSDSATLTIPANLSLPKSLSIAETVNINYQVFINLSKKLVILLDGSITTDEVLVIVQTLSSILGAGFSASVGANPGVGIPLGVDLGSGNNAVMFAGSGIGVLYSIVTVGDLNVIIVKGIVSVSDSAKNSISGYVSSKNEASSGHSYKSKVDSSDS